MTDSVRDLLDRAVGWYEPPDQLLEAARVRMERRRIRRRVSAGAIGLVVSVLGALLVWLAFRPAGGQVIGSTDLTPIPPPGDQRVFGPAVVLASGDVDGRPWKLLAYQSESGLCVDLEIEQGAAGGCGAVPIDGDLVLMQGGVFGLDKIILHGMVSERVAAVEVRSVKGHPVATPIIPDPGEMGVNFFVLFVPPDALGEVVAVDAAGNVLDSARLRPVERGEPPASVVQDEGNPPTASVTRCIQAETSGDFDGDGSMDDAEFFEIVSGSVSCHRGGEVFENLSSQELVIRFGSGQTLEQPFTDCQGGLCAYIFEAADLNGHGHDELAIDVSSAAAIGLVEFYRVDLDGIRPLIIAEPGDPPYVEPGPAILGGGFDSGLQSPIECRVNDDGTRELVSIHAENVGDSLSGPWQVHTTTMVLRDERLVVTGTNDSESSFPGTSGIPSFSETAPLDNECS
jgi:hypothetical protein